MKAPQFWWQDSGGLASLLAPLSFIYRCVADHNLTKTGKNVGVPVIDIGNFVVGGAGKTPVSLLVAQLLTNAGYKPVMLSRGYKGALAGPVLVNSADHSANQVGDEAILISNYLPVVVAKDRLAGGNLAKAYGDIIVMDDGLQNRRLNKTFSLAVVDGHRGIGNAKVMPSGPLRASMSQQWPLVDAIMIIDKSPKSMNIETVAKRLAKPVFFGQTRVIIPSAIKGREVIAWCGIANPTKFFTSLEQAGCKLAGRYGFGDHALPTPNQIAAIVKAAKENKIPIVTTGKDYARLNNATGLLAKLKNSSNVVDIKLVLSPGDQSALLNLIKAAMVAKSQTIASAK